MKARHRGIFGCALLALSLTMAAEPARAASLRAEQPALSRALDWLSLWWQGAVAEGRGLSHFFGRAGAGSDPDGRAGSTPPPTNSGGSGSLSAIRGEEGAGADPDGNH